MVVGVVWRVRDAVVGNKIRASWGRMMNGGHRNRERLRPVDRPGVLHDHRHPHRLDRAINLAGTINEPSRNYMRPIGRAGRVPPVGKKKGGTICDVATEGRTIEEPLQGKASVGWPTGSPRGINRYCTGDDRLLPSRSGYERSGNRRVPLKPEKRQRTIRQIAEWRRRRWRGGGGGGGRWGGWWGR